MGNVDAGSMTIALLTACSDPEGPGIRSEVVQQLLDEATEDAQTARAVLTTMLTASVVSLRAFTEAARRDRADVLQTLGMDWTRRRLGV
jgi:hypothetical protein